MERSGDGDLIEGGEDGNIEQKERANGRNVEG